MDQRLDGLKLKKRIYTNVVVRKETCNLSYLRLEGFVATGTLPITPLLLDDFSRLTILLLSLTPMFRCAADWASFARGGTARLPRFNSSVLISYGIVFFSLTTK